MKLIILTHQDFLVKLAFKQFFLCGFLLLLFVYFVLFFLRRVPVSEEYDVYY